MAQTWRIQLLSVLSGFLTCFFFSAMRKASCEHVCHQDAGMAQTWRIRLLSVLSRLVAWPRLVAYLGDHSPWLLAENSLVARRVAGEHVFIYLIHHFKNMFRTIFKNSL